MKEPALVQADTYLLLFAEGVLHITEKVFNVDGHILRGGDKCLHVRLSERLLELVLGVESELVCQSLIRFVIYTRQYPSVHMPT